MRAPELAITACLFASCYRDASTDTPSNHAAGAPSDDLLTYLPVDSQVVFGFDVARMRASPLWARFEPRIATEMRSELDEVRTSCGFDPTQTVQQAAIGLRWMNNDVTGVAVVHGVDTTRVLECIATEFGKNTEHAVTDRGVVLMDPKSRKASAWTVVGSDTLVMQIAPGANHDSLTNVLASGAPLRQSPAFMEMYGHLDRGASVWAVINGAAEALDFFDQDTRPRTIEGTVVTTDRVTITGRVKMATPASATKVAEMIKHDVLREMAFLTRHDVVASGSVVKVDLALTADQLDTAFGMAGIR